MNTTSEEYLLEDAWKVLLDGNSTPIMNITVGWMDGPTGKLIDQTISVISVIVLFTTMISLGCTMELSRIKVHILKPKGVLIAVFSQYGIMPLTAFSLAKMFRLSSIESLSVLICGCCPGGTLSNIFSLALNGDMNLSIVMTTCSTVLAFGMMPLLLYLYCKGLSLANKVPYREISITLVLMLIPCGIGIFLNHKYPKYSKTITKTGLFILLVTAIIIGILSGMSIGNTLWMLFSPRLLVTTALMPGIGYTLGYALSCLCRLPERCKRTVSMETGCQNIQLCATILKVAFRQEEIGSLYLFPLIFLVFQLSEALILVVIYQSYERIKRTKEHSAKMIYVPVENTMEHLTLPEFEKPRDPAVTFKSMEAILQKYFIGSEALWDVLRTKKSRYKCKCFHTVFSAPAIDVQHGPKFGSSTTPEKPTAQLDYMEMTQTAQPNDEMIQPERPDLTFQAPVAGLQGKKIMQKSGNCARSQCIMTVNEEMMCDARFYMYADKNKGNLPSEAPRSSGLPDHVACVSGTNAMPQGVWPHTEGAYQLQDQRSANGKGTSTGTLPQIGSGHQGQYREQEARTLQPF
uniref:hepatic sodium/bile acid cotransporter n=1 Tax=Pristiophorus japonicus TaxID=55135 RepID=UPI00398F77EB